MDELIITLEIPIHNQHILEFVTAINKTNNLSAQLFPVVEGSRCHHVKIYKVAQCSKISDQTYFSE